MFSHCAWSLGALLCLVAPAVADPFTGRYNIVTVPDRGVSIAGYIDFLNAPMGTDTFNLRSPFVTGFLIQASGPGISTLTYDTLVLANNDHLVTFDSPLGDPTLHPTRPVSGVTAWIAIGDLDGQGDVIDRLQLAAGIGHSDWVVHEDIFTAQQVQRGQQFGDPPHWKLVFVPVPEPAPLIVIALCMLGLVCWARRGPAGGSPSHRPLCNRAVDPDRAIRTPMGTSVANGLPGPCYGRGSGRP